MNYFTEGAVIIDAITTTNGADAQTAIAGVNVDMAGFDTLVAILEMGSITSGAVTSVKWQGATTDALLTSDPQDLEGSSLSITDAWDGKHVILELVKPIHRFNRIYVTRGTQNATVTKAIYLKLNPRSLPVTADATCSIEVSKSPAVGTA